ncbi:MAG: hypothetical protein HYT62_02155 [Candidatus Yanofskybacteria bacterium]|nr:hypothetical protein [Candidatus Yanofskybacteria bacterium]
MNKKYLIGGLVIAVIIGGFLLFVSRPDRENPLPASQQIDSTEILSNLERDVNAGIQYGGINPELYDQIDFELAKIESQGFQPERTAVLRIKMDQLNVGGRSKPTPVPSKAPAQATTQASTKVVVKPSPVPQERYEGRPFWVFKYGKWVWEREGTPPLCPELILPLPIDINLITGILYPGQVRGDGPEDFKSHGGFQLKPVSKIEIKAPMDGYLTSVAKFTDEFGLHYSLIFQHPCGIQFWGGHWGALPPDIQVIMDKVPMKNYGDSRTEDVAPYFVKKGQVIVTGLQEKGNSERPGFDWGVADLRQENEASKDSGFRDLYGDYPGKNYYGVCWLDLLPPEEKSIIKGLPGVDMKSGKYSEYCK